MTKLVATMWKLGLILILLSSCSNMPANQNRQSQAPSNQPDAVQAIEQQTTELILAEDSVHSISLTGTTQSNSDTITPITLHIGANSKTYQWHNVNEAEYYPQLTVTDLNQDGKNEIYLFLTKGFGANTLETQLNIVKEDFSEITSPNPFADIKNKVATLAKEQDNIQQYTVKLNNKLYTYTFKPDESAMWFEDIVFGKIIEYRIENNRLIVSLSLQVSPTITVGMLEMSYQYKENQFKLTTITLTETPQEEKVVEPKK